MLSCLGTGQVQTFAPLSMSKLIFCSPIYSGFQGSKVQGIQGTQPSAWGVPPPHPILRRLGNRYIYVNTE